MSRLLVVFIAALMGLAACTGAGEGETSTTAGGSTTISAPVETTQAPETTSTTLPPGTEELPEALRAELADLIAQAEAVRGLEFLEQPSVTVVTDAELAQRVRDQLEEDLEDLPADQALYDLLGLIEDGTDLGALYADLYSEQVAGYYDGETGELVVPMAEDGFNVTQKITLVHELVHALTDQHFGFHDRYIEMLDNDRIDEASALQAVIEGDAVLAQFLYLQSLPPEEQGRFFAEAFDVSTDVFDAAPQFIRDSLVFPYDSGFIFVDRLHSAGGFGPVADAYASPPVSTEQIIDPSSYPDEVPLAPSTPGLDLAGYDLAYSSTWGELGFSLMFRQFLPDSEADTASSGWGGDSYEVWYDGSDVVFALHYQGDSTADAQELGTALRSYVNAAMDVGEAEPLANGTGHQGTDNAWVLIEGADVYFVAASDPDVFDEAVAQTRPDQPTATTTDG